jgi:uncharacterized OB-fold protein
MNEEQALRPAPWITRDSAFFWEAAKREELVGQSCADCGVLRAPPRPMCPHCNSLKSEARRLSGRGSVTTWVIPRYPPIPGFEGTHIVAVITLEEGVRMVSNICGIEYDDIVADMPVEVFFEDTRDGFKIPLFRPLPG